MKDTTWLWIIGGAAVALSLGGFEYVMGDLSATQITQFARNAGFTGSDLVTAVAVALAESSGNPNAHGDITIGSGTGSFGLWQINADAHPEYGPDFTVLFDPQTNANAAYEIYQNAGFKFIPWTTYTHHTYLSFVSQAQNA